MSEFKDPKTAKVALLHRLTVEQHNGGGFISPPKQWNAHASTAALTFNDDDVTRARRRKEALAEWEAAHEEETG